MGRTKQNHRGGTIGGGKVPRKAPVSQQIHKASSHHIPRKHTNSRALGSSANYHALIKDAKKNKRPGTIALRQIAHYSRGAGATGVLIRRAPFQRMVRCLLQQYEANQKLYKDEKGVDVIDPDTEYRMSAQALLCLQEAVEMWLVRMIEHANIAAAHAKRVTLMPKDLRLIERLNRSDFPSLPFAVSTIEQVVAPTYLKAQYTGLSLDLDENGMPPVDEAGVHADRIHVHRKRQSWEQRHKAANPQWTKADPVRPPRKHRTG